MTDHNHITRDIKPLGAGCSGCDEYHINALHMKIAELRDQRNAARAEVAALRECIAQGIEAFRLTKEYVNVPDENGFVLLPDVEGWSHWDWTLKARAALEEES